MQLQNKITLFIRLRHRCPAPWGLGASLAVLLNSPNAGFITGQNFIADDGMIRKMIYI